MSLINIPSIITQFIEGFLTKHKTASYIILLLISLGGFFIDFKVAEDNSLSSVIRELRIDNEYLKKQNLQKDSTIMAIKEEMSILKLSFLTLQTSMEEAPMSMYVKSMGTRNRPGIMLYLNPHYEKTFLYPFGKTRGDYVGKTDQEFWGLSLGHVYWSKALQVLTMGQIIDSYVPNPINPSDSIRIIEYPRIYNGSKIGVAGMVLPFKN